MNTFGMLNDCLGPWAAFAGKLLKSILVMLCVAPLGGEAEPVGR